MAAFIVQYACISCPRVFLTVKGKFYHRLSVKIKVVVFNDEEKLLSYRLNFGMHIITNGYEILCKSNK